MERLAELIEALPEDLRRRAVTHSSWVGHRTDSYGRLAFIGDGVLGLAVALPAHYPNHFDTLGHLGLIYLATLIFVAGALLALRGIITQHRG